MGCMGCTCPMGVPGCGFKKLSGTDSTFNCRKVSANSMRWSTLSPMPRIPPQQTFSPTSRASLTTLTSSS